MTKKVLLLVLNCFWAFIIHAQSKEVIKAIAQELHLSKEFMKTNLDSALFYAEKSVEESLAINNDTLIAKSYIQKSNVLIFKRDFDAAERLMQLNIENKELPSHIVGKTWHTLGTISYYQQDLENALMRYLKAAAILEKTENPEQLANTYANIGSLNAALKNYGKTEQYLKKALTLVNSDEGLRLKVLYNLSTFYFDQKSYQAFAENIAETEVLAKKQNAGRILSGIYTNLTMYHTDVEVSHQKALDYGKKSITLKKKLKRIQQLSLSYNNVGYSYLKNGEYRNAIAYFDSSMAGATEIAKPVLYNNLKDAYFGLKEYKKALYYADIKDQLKDSLTNGAEKEKVAELLEKFESEKKQQEIDMLDAKNAVQTLTIRQQKQGIFALVSLSLLAIILGYFGFRSVKTKQHLDKLLSQQKLLKSQLNPHFLFNALQSIQHFIYKNDKEKSSAYLSSYAKLMRSVLENSDADFIAVSDDVIAIDAYLKLQQLAHDNSFEYSVLVDEGVAADFDRLPPMITQPFVENAVLHGVKDIERGKISVHYYKENKALIVVIQDNGKGMQQKDNESKRLHKSMSTRVVQEQFKALKSISRNFEGTIAVDNEAGTKVTLRILID